MIHLFYAQRYASWMSQYAQKLAQNEEIPHKDRVRLMQKVTDITTPNPTSGHTIIDKYLTPYVEEWNSFEWDFITPQSARDKDVDPELNEWGPIK